MREYGGGEVRVIRKRLAVPSAVLSRTGWTQRRNLLGEPLEFPERSGQREVDLRPAAA